MRGRVPTVDVLRTQMAILSGVKPVVYHCCKNSCACFTGAFSKLRYCPVCSAPRYGHDGKPQKVFHYLPVTQRLRHLFSNKDTAERLQYRATFKTRGSAVDPAGLADPAVQDDYWDIFDGDHYLSLLEKKVTVDEEPLQHNFFSDPRDIALGLSFDGFCPASTPVGPSFLSTTTSHLKNAFISTISSALV